MGAGNYGRFGIKERNCICVYCFIAIPVRKFGIGDFAFCSKEHLNEYCHEKVWSERAADARTEAARNFALWMLGRGWRQDCNRAEPL